MTKIIENLSNEDYHKSSALSNSGISHIIKNVSVFKWAQEAKEIEKSDDLTIGSATHTLILEGREQYEKEYIVAPKFDLRTKAGKEAKAEFIKKSEGKTVLSADDGKLVENMAESVMCHPTARGLLAEGQPEVSMFWKDEDTGIDCRIRPDWLDRERNIIVDLKTSADLKKLTSKVLDFGYHRQDQFYTKGFEAVTGESLEGFFFIFVSKAKSLGRHEVRVIELSEAFKAKGLAEVNEALENYYYAQKNDDWAQIEELELPKWAQA